MGELHPDASQHGAGLPTLLGLLILARFFPGFDSGVERLLSGANEQFGQIQLGRMSPLTAGAFLLESAALLLLLHATRWRFASSIAALFALLGTTINLVVSVGYFNGVPLLYGGATIPVALPTALAFVLVGVGESGLALSGAPALRAWSGDSTRGVLLRAFLPGVLLLILFEGWLDSRSWIPVAPNPVLWHSLEALLACVLIVALIAWTARRTGDALERAQKALHESESQYRQLFESSSDALFPIATDTGQIVGANALASELYGYDRDELLTKTAMDMSAEPEDTWQRTQKARTRPNQVFRIPLLLHRKKDGSVFPVEITARSLVREGQMVVLVSSRDITDRKRAESEREHLQLQLAQAQKMESIGRLAGGVAHDFNNLLNVILGYSGLVLRGLKRGEPVTKSLTEIQKAAERAADLTRQLLAFSRRQTLQPKALGLNSAIAGCEKMLRRIIGEDIDLVIIPGSGLGLAKADPGQLDQILMNLAVNSRDAMPHGGKLIVETANVELDQADIRVNPEVKQGSYVMLAVRDTGLGMDKETQGRT